MIKVLMDNQRKMMINRLKSQPLKKYAAFLIMLAIMAALLYFLSKGVWAVAGLMSSTALVGIVSYGFLIIIGFIILLGLPQIYKHLYAATDLEFLFTLPIPTQHIFWMKYMQSFTGIPLFLFIFFSIPLCIYGFASGVSPVYYPVTLLVLLAVVIIGLSSAFLINLLIIQIIPARRANELMTVLSFMAGIGGYLLIMLPNMMGEERITERISRGLTLFPEWSPMSWAGNAVMHAAGGRFNFVWPFVLLVLLAVVSMLLATTLVEKGFRTGWIRLSEGSTNKKKKTKKKVVSHGLSHPVIAVGKKEWLTIKRDLREWFVFMPIGMFVVFALIGFFSGGGHLSDIRGARDISWPIAQAILLFLYAVFNGNMAASSVGREGASEWMMRVLPLTGKYIAAGKLWISWLIPFILMTGIEIIGGMVMGWSLVQFASGIIIKGLATFGMSAIGLWIGTIGAKYNPVNPQQRLKFGVSFIMLISSYVYLIILLIPFGYVLFPVEQIDLPSNLDHGLTGFKGIIASIVLSLLSLKVDYPIVMTIVGVLVMLLLAIGIALLFAYLSVKRFDKGVRIDRVDSTHSKGLFAKRKPGESLY